MFINKWQINHKWITVHEATLYVSVFSILVWNCLITVSYLATHFKLFLLDLLTIIYIWSMLYRLSQAESFSDWVLLSDETWGNGLEHSSVGEQHTLRVASSSDCSTASDTQKAGDILQDVSATHQSYSGWSPKAFWWDDAGPRSDRCGNTSSEIQNHLAQRPDIVETRVISLFIILWYCTVIYNYLFSQYNVKSPIL